jgi:hypothetical protein
MSLSKPTIELLLPSFLGIGVQKGGTTSLASLLRQHPLIHLPPKKELQYFTYHSNMPLSWYASQWSNADSYRVRGEITPYYIFHPYAHQRIRSTLPFVKLIILLRDPVERTLSQYFHAKRLGHESLDLQDALSSEDERLADSFSKLETPGYRDVKHQENSYLSRSRYECQLPRWMSSFPANNLLMLRSEFLFSQPSDAWEIILQFLGVANIAFPACGLGRVNAGRNEASSVSALLRDRIRMQLITTYDYLEEIGLGWPNPC